MSGAFDVAYSTTLPLRHNTSLTVTRRWPSAAVSSGIMLALLLVSLISAFILLCLFFPSVRMSIMAVDESLDAHEAGLALVAARMCICRCHKCFFLTRLFIRKTIPREWTTTEYGPAYHASA